MRLLKTISGQFFESFSLWKSIPDKRDFRKASQFEVTKYIYTYLAKTITLY
jgi:hypothetical protein